MTRSIAEERGKVRIDTARRCVISFAPISTLDGLLARRQRLDL
jgi:hypothetical protein